MPSLRRYKGEVAQPGERGRGRGMVVDAISLELSQAAAAHRGLTRGSILRMKIYYPTELLVVLLGDVRG